MPKAGIGRQTSRLKPPSTDTSILFAAGELTIGHEAFRTFHLNAFDHHDRKWCSMAKLLCLKFDDTCELGVIPQWIGDGNAEPPLAWAPRDGVGVPPIARHVGIDDELGGLT